MAKLEVAGYCCSIPANELALALLGDLKIVRPEPVLIEKLMMKITPKSQIEFRQAGTKAS